MQTRRDQLQAYRFQNRRALAALVTGQPNVLEPPMRRLTVTTISGIMIAILIAIVFGVLAIIRPSAGTSWQNSGKVIVDQDNNSIYVYSKGTLHPALNYTSAVLAVSGANSVSRVTVSSSDIAGARYGYEIGSPEFPNSLPGSGSLISYPMSACSVLQPRDTRGGDARVTLHIGSKGGSTKVPSAQAVAVTSAGGDGTEWLLLGGERLQIGSLPVSSSLGITTTTVVDVGNAFLDSIPQGVTLSAPTVPGHDRLADFTLGGGAPPKVGSLVRTTDPAGTYLVTRSHLVPLTPLEQALYPGVHPTNATSSEVTPHELGSSAPASQNPLAGFTRLPQTVPTIDSAAFGRGGVCAVYDRANGAPHLVIPRGSLTNYIAANNHQSDVSTHGKADKVDVPATKALLAVSSDAPGTVLVVSEQGVRYSFAEAGLINAFGYQASDEVHVPAQLVALIPSGGTGLSQSAALKRAPR